jgi:transcription termination/antitermination protein NusG
MEKGGRGAEREEDGDHRKLYPGYVFVDMALLDENQKLVEKPWYFIRDTPGIIGFVGGERPTPTPDGGHRIDQGPDRESEDTERPKVSFEWAKR